MNDIDELTLVARLRQDVRSGAGLAGAHRRLAAEISAATKVSAGAPRHRTVRGHGAARGRGRLVIAGAVAAAIAVTVAVGYGLLPGRPASTATIPARPGRTTAPATGPARTGPVRTEAELVDYATRAASAAPAFNPGPDEWIYAKIETAASSAGTGGFLFGPPNKRVTSSNWTRVDLSRVASLQHGRIVFTPMLAGTLAGWPNISYRYLESLPTDPAKLEAVIAANVRHQSPTGSGPVGIFSAIDYLMSSQLRAVLPPRLYAGLYGVLARLPQVRFDRVTDLAGRPGVGLSIVEEGYIKAELVINPVTYAYMGDLFVAIKAHTAVGLDGTWKIKKGQVLGWSALLRSGIVHQAGQLP